MSRKLKPADYSSANARNQEKLTGDSQCTQGDQRKCGKTVEDEVKNAGNNQSQKIGGGGYQVDSYLKALCRKRKNVTINTSCYIKSYA